MTRGAMASATREGKRGRVGEGRWQAGPESLGERACAGGLHWASVGRGWQVGPGARLREGRRGEGWAALGHAGWKGGGTAWARKVGSGPRERGKRVGRAQGEVGWALVWAAGFGFCWVSFPLFFSISKQLKPI